MIRTAHDLSIATGHEADSRGTCNRQLEHAVGEQCVKIGKDEYIDVDKAEEREARFAPRSGGSRTGSPRWPVQGAPAGEVARAAHQPTKAFALVNRAVSTPKRPLDHARLPATARWGGARRRTPICGGGEAGAPRRKATWPSGEYMKPK